MANLHGVFAVTVTPFTDSGAIDYAAAASHLDWLLESGVHGVLPAGATGEFAAFTLDERKAYAEFVITHVAGRVPVCVGAVSQNVDTVLEVARHAAQIGAAGVMCLLPPGLHPNQEEAFNFFKILSQSVTLPVMVYNNPGSCGVDIAPETMARIAALPHMEYLKESTGDIKRLTMMTDTLSDKIITFCGCENLAFESFVMGAKGWVCVLANIAPGMSVKIYESVVLHNDLPTARAIYQQVLPMLRLFEETGQLWQVVKYVLQARGIGNGLCRAPRLPITDDVRAQVDAVLQAVKLY